MLLWRWIYLYDVSDFQQFGYFPLFIFFPKLLWYNQKSYNSKNHLIQRIPKPCIIATKRSTNISVAESTTDMIATELQNLHNCNRCCHLYNCYRKCIIVSMNCTVYSLLKIKREIKRQAKRQIDIPPWTHMGHNGWSEDGKTFTRCYTIALKF